MCVAHAYASSSVLREEEVITLSHQGARDWTSPPIPLLRPFDPAQGERSVPPLGTDSGSGAGKTVVYRSFGG